MPTSQKFSVSKLSQQGIAPIILIIILTVVIAGVAGVAYQSKKEIKIRSDKTSEVTELKSVPVSPSSNKPTPKKEEAAVDQNKGLASKPIELQVDQATTSSPKFSIIPPAGWEKLASSGNIIVELDSPTKDKITEGVVIFKVQPNITVFVEQKDFKDFAEVIKAADQNGESFGYQTTSQQRNRLNGEDVYIVQSTIDLADMARKVLEDQIKQEIAKSGEDIPKDVVQKDIDKVVAQAKGRALSYIFYKNGYYVNVTGKALESYWSQREGQLKQSLDTFKFE